MRPLHLYCDKQHPHQSWRPRIQDGKLIFPTAEEAAYPWLLCTRIINLAIDAAKRLGAVLFTTLQEQLNHADFTLMNRYIFEALPRSTKLRPLVPEFSHYTFVVTPGTTCGSLQGCLATYFPKAQKFCPADFGHGGLFGRNNTMVNVFSWSFQKRTLPLTRRLSVTMWASRMDPWNFWSRPYRQAIPKI